MRKQTHFKKVVSFALAAAMAVSVCTAALADETTNEATKEASASEQIETKSADKTENGIDALTAEEGGQPVVLALEDEDAATIDGNSSAYKTVQEAINNAKSEVVLSKNTTENIEIPAGKSIVLNLGGQTLTGKVTVHGNLTVKDTSYENPPIVHESEDYWVLYSGGEIKNNGTAVQVEGGTFTLESGTIRSMGYLGVSAVGNTNTGADREAVNSVINIKGGYVVAPEYAASAQGKGATINVSGGVLEATDNAVIGGNGTVSSTEDLGGTFVNVTGGTLIGHIKSNGYIACGIYQPQAGELNVSGGTIYAGGGCGIMARAGNVSVYGDVNIITTGTATGWVGDNKNVLSSSAIVLDKKASYPGADTAKYDTAIDIHAQITGGTFTSATDSPIEVIVNADDTTQYITVAGGTFNNKFDASYLASNYVFKTNDDGTYTVDVKTVDTKPAEPEKTEVAGKTEDIKSEDVKKEDVANAAGSTTIADSKDASVSDVSAAVKGAATVKVGNEEVKLDDSKVVDVAKEAIAKAVKDSAAAEKPAEVFDPDAENKDITIVAVPKLVVEPKAAADNETDKSMTFDINMVYDVKATVADTVDKMNDQNTVTLENNKPMPKEQVPTVAISLDVSALKIPEGQKVFVRHVKENGEVYYYAADTTVEDGIVKTITFVNPDGFSEFTVMANKTVTVTIDGKEYALSAADIGKGFEIAKKDYCDWKGVSFKGIEGVYTTLTKELYDKAANGQKLEGHLRPDRFFRQDCRRHGQHHPADQRRNADRPDCHYRHHRLAGPGCDCLHEEKAELRSF